MGRRVGLWSGSVQVHQEADPWTAAAAAAMAALCGVPGAGHWYAKHWIGAALLTTTAAIGVVFLTLTAWQMVGLGLLVLTWLGDLAHAPLVCRKRNLRLRAALGPQ